MRTLIAVLVFGSALSAQTTGSITGVISSATDGTIVPGASVSAIRLFSATPTTAPLVTTASTDTQGAYRFDGLPPASYRLCVYPGDTLLLDPCSWSDQPPLWNLTRGETATVNISLAVGQFIHVQVADPNGNLKRHEEQE